MRLCRVWLWPRRDSCGSTNWRGLPYRQDARSAPARSRLTGRKSPHSSRIDHPRGIEAVKALGADEVLGAPMPERRMSDEVLSTDNLYVILTADYFVEV